MGKLEARIPLRGGPGSPQESPNRSQVPPRAQWTHPVGLNMHVAGSTETASLGRTVSTQPKPHGSAAQYVIALSQTDTKPAPTTPLTTLR